MKYSFTKVFTDGLLKGMEIREEMSFTDTKRFVGWALAVNKKHAHGELPYRVYRLGV